jgi:hypothetical protein
MTITQRTDDVLLDLAGSANGRLRDIFGIDQWTSARVLIRLFLVLVVTSQLAMVFERGFAWGNMLILGVWIWHYATAASGIERYARSPHGSSIARITERPYRSMYPFIYAALALVVGTFGTHASGLLMLAGWAAMIGAHYVKAAEMPPASRRSGGTAPAFQKG